MTDGQRGGLAVSTASQQEGPLNRPLVWMWMWMVVCLYMSALWWTGSLSRVNPAPSPPATQERISGYENEWMNEWFVMSQMILKARPLKIWFLMNTEKVSASSTGCAECSLVSNCIYFFLHSESQTCNCNNKKKNTFWLDRDQTPSAVTSKYCLYGHK